jgi:predicted nucleotidyltransferase
MESESNRQNEIVNLIRKACEANKKLLEGYKIILFGSRARENTKSRADFDLGIVGKEPLDLKFYFELKDAIDNLPTLFHIDLVDLSCVHEKFRNEALKNYQVIYG